MTAVHMGENIKVFVHLAHGYGALNWNGRYRDGRLLGINEPFAYGYYRAADHGCSIVYSEDKVENRLEKLFRLGLRFFLHFDFLHAWRNRKGIVEADVVWTHTESQHLAILLLFLLLRPIRRPRLIAQSVWLFDRWHRFSFLHQWLFRKLLARADILTVLSPENLKVARMLFPHIRAEFVLMGIRADQKIPPRRESLHKPVRLIALGNDEHRDWATLIEAVRGLESCELRIASQKVEEKLLAGAPNISVAKIKSSDDLMGLYAWADVMVLALKPNLHASGITVLEEAALCGVPAICSDIGGLSAYFSNDDVLYVKHGNPEALRRAITDMMADDGRRWAYAARAGDRMGTNGLSSESYVRRHVELSRELLSIGSMP